MKKLGTLGIIFCLIITCLGGAVQLQHMAVLDRKKLTGASPTPTPTPYLINQGFEGTGYDNGETWTEGGTGGTVDEDYSTSPIVDSQSLEIITSTQLASTTASFTAGDTRYGFFRFRWHVQPTTTVQLARIQTSSFGAVAIISIINTHRIRIATTGGTNADSSTPIPQDTDIYLWWKYVKGTGTNGLSAVGWSTDGSLPDLSGPTGGQVAVSSNGTVTTQAGSILIGVGSSSIDFIYDRILVSANPIPANP